jgi:hypothetical protein
MQNKTTENLLVIRPRKRKKRRRRKPLVLASVPILSGGHVH